MKDVLAQVRRHRGGGAVILGTREIRRRRLFGLGARELIEVTATVSDPLSESSAATPGSNDALHAQFSAQLSRLHALVDDLSRQGRLEHLLPDLPSELA